MTGDNSAKIIAAFFNLFLDRMVIHPDEFKYVVSDSVYGYIRHEKTEIEIRVEGGFFNYKFRNPAAPFTFRQRIRFWGSYRTWQARKRTLEERAKQEELAKDFKLALERMTKDIKALERLDDV